MSGDAAFMREALAEAAQAARSGEVPVGAVVVHAGRVIGRGHNRSIGEQDVTAHAEIQALRQASRALGNYRLEDCELYVTLEPCVMCSGALMGARIRRVVFGAAEPRTGAAGSVLDVFAEPRLNHHTQVTGGVLAEECGLALQQFFQGRRQAQQLERASSFLREDALRLPQRLLPAWPPGLASRYTSALPALQGLRLHALQAGEGAATVLALHGPGQWSAAYVDAARQLAGGGLGLLAPDLIGFGLSDKPKKASWHTLDAHAAVLQEWLAHIAPAPMALVAPRAMQALAARLASTVPGLAWFSIDEPLLGADVLDLPYPDRGHRSGPRVLPGLLASSPASAPPARPLHGPDWPTQLQQLLKRA